MLLPFINLNIKKGSKLGSLLVRQYNSNFLEQA